MENGSSVGSGINDFPSIDNNSIAPDFDKMKPIEAIANKEKLSKSTLRPISDLYPKSKEPSFLDKATKKIDSLTNKFLTGSSQLGVEMSATPELLYDTFSAPQNAIADILDLPNLKTDSEKFKKNVGITNDVKDYYKREVSKLREHAQEVDNKYKDGIYDSFLNGDFSGGFDQLTNSFAESLPVTSSIMVGGAAMKAPQLIAASSALFGADKNERLKDENPEMGTNARVVNSLLTGLIQGATESLGTGSIGAAAKGIVEREGTKKAVTILKDGLTKYYKAALKKNPLLSSMTGEGIEEAFQGVAENAVDVATGAKPTDFNIYGTMTDDFIGGAFAGSVFGGGLKGLEHISNVQDKKTVKSNFKKTFELQRQLENPDISEPIKTELQKNIDILINHNKTLVEKNVKHVDDLHPQVQEKLQEAVFNNEEIKNKTKEIKLDSGISDSSKQILLDNLKSEFQSNQDIKNSILDGTAAIDVLPINEEDKLERDSLKEPTNEQNPDEGKSITIPNEQVLEHTTKNYSESNESINTDPEAKIDKSISIGDYNYMFSEGEWKASDKNGNSKPKSSKYIPEKVYEKHAETFDFTKGETALDANKINDVSTWEEDIAEHSNNPLEVADALMNAKIMDATEGLDTQSKHIAEAIGSKGVERSSFANRTGKKGMKDIPGSLALQYFSKKGKGNGLDIIAQNAEIAMYGDWDSQNPRITEDDVFNFINDNPRGAYDFLNHAKKEKINALKTAFTHLTGLPANDKYMGKAIEQGAEKDYRFKNEEVLHQYSDEDLISLANEYGKFINNENEKSGQTNQTDGDGTPILDKQNQKTSQEQSGIPQTRGGSIDPERGNYEGAASGEKYGGGITKDEKSSITEELTHLEAAFKKVLNSSSDYVLANTNDTKNGIKEGIKRTNETANKIADVLKLYTEKGVITSRQASILTQKALKTNFNPIAVSNYLNYAYKVMRNADYAAMLTNANSIKKTIKTALRSNFFPKSTTTVDIVKSFLRINPRSVDDINEYNSIGSSIKNNLKGIKISKDGAISNESLEISNNSIRLYVNEQLKIQQEKAKNQLIADYKNFVDSGIIDPKQMSLQQMQTIVEAIEKGDEVFDEYANELKAEDLAKKENAIRQITNSQITSLEDYLKEQRIALGDGTMQSVLTETEKNSIQQIQSIDTSTLSLKELMKLNDVLNNIIQNSDYSGSGDITIVSEYQKDKSKLSGIIDTSGIKLGRLHKQFSEIASLNQLSEFISKSTKVAAEIQRLTGISAVFNGHATAKIGYNKVLNQYADLKKLFGADVDSAENRYRRGIYSRIIQHLGGTEIDQLSEFVRIKDWIKQTGERLSSLDKNDFPKEVKEGEIVNKIYNELLEGSNTIAEVKSKLEKIAPKNIKLVNFWIDVHDKKAEQLFENSEVFNNKSLEKVAHYTATSVKGLGKKSFIENSKERDIFESNFFNKKIDNKESGVKNNRTKAKNLPANAALDLDFDSVQSKKYYEAVYDIETNKAIAKVRKAFSDPEMAKILGGISNIKILENAVRQSILAQKNKLPIPANLEGKIVKTLSAFQAKGARMALGSITQLPKQYISVAWNTLVNLGTNSPLFFKALTIGNNLELFDNVNVGLRGETKAGLNRDLNFNEIDKVNFGNNLEKGISKVNEVGLKVAEGIMKSLETSDVAVARTSWLAYYLQDLQKQGIKIDAIDWNKEHLNINEEATAYAEQQVSRNQNPNDISSGAVAFKDRGYGQIVKNVYLPFSTFAINQRVRMTNDVQKLVYGGEKQEALKSLGATFVEQAVFNSIKILALAPLASVIGKGMLSAFGYDEDEKEDIYKNAGKKFGSNLFSDFFFSGMGTLPQEGLQHISNQITKATMDKEFFYNYDPTKFGQPEFIKYLGIYGTTLAAANTSLDYSKYIDGKTTKVTHGGFESKIKTSEVEMSNKETRLAKAIFIIDFMNLAGVSDAFVNQINSHVKKGFKKEMEKNYGGKKVVIVTKGKKKQYGF